MEIMVDASTIICIILNEPEKAKIISLTEDAEIVSPEMISFEIGNALSRMVRKQRLNEEQALKAYSLFESILIRIVKVDMHKALKIFCKYEMYAYDAYYLEASRRIKLPLLTLDKGMKDKAKNMNIGLLDIDPLEISQ
jgi:predicted nucleic acid-binding protein